MLKSLLPHPLFILFYFLYRSSVRGTPGVDYPIFGASAFSLSTFSCEDRVMGVYYADQGLGCQVIKIKVCIIFVHGF